jgi:hypothetical protein
MLIRGQDLAERPRRLAPRNIGQISEATFEAPVSQTEADIEQPALARKPEDTT